MMLRRVVAAAVIAIVGGACADSSGAPPTGLGARGLDSIVIDRSRVDRSKQDAPWPDTVESALAMRIRSFGSGPAPTDGYTVALSADDGGALDSTTIRMGPRDSAFVTWTLGTHVGPEHLTATAAGRSTSYAVQVQPGLPDTLVLLGAVPNVRVGDTIVLPQVQLLDRFLDTVRLAGFEVEAWGRFADARDTVPAYPAGQDGGVAAKTDSSGRATLPRLINRGPVGSSTFSFGWSGVVPFLNLKPNGSSGGVMGLGGTTFANIVSTPGPPANLLTPSSIDRFGERGSTTLVDIVVVDIGANPLPGVGVNVRVVEGDGTAPSFVVTDSLGVAHVPFTLQPNTGSNALQFSAPWLPSCSQCYRFSIFGV